MTVDWDQIRQTLTPAEYQAYRLHSHGMSQRAIAAALQINRTTVRDRLDNARRKLAQLGADAA